MHATLKLRDPEFVGDYITQQINNFCKTYPEMSEHKLKEFCNPIQSGMENILRENRELRNTLDMVIYNTYDMMRIENV